LEQVGPREIKLSPQVRREALTQAVPTIPLDVIQPFLSRPRVVSRTELDGAPRVVGFAQEHIAGGVGDPFYVSGMEDTDLDLDRRKFELVRAGPAYIDPETGETLGHEAIYVGQAELLRPGDPAKLVLTFAQREVQFDDRLLPDLEGEPMENFLPVPGPPMFEGRIISVLNGVSQIGLYNVVVLNKGQDAGLEPGQMLQVLQRTDLPYAMRTGSLVERPLELPLEDVGILMVFRTFDRVSYALVMRASGVIHLGDSVRSPDT